MEGNDDNGTDRHRRWWLRLSNGPRWVALALAVVGVLLVALSALPGDQGVDDAWGRDFLMTVGASFALFAPFYLITRSMDRHLDRVAAETAEQVEVVRTETAEQVQQVRGEAAAGRTELAGEVQALREDVGRQLSDIFAQVQARLQEEAAADEAAFQSLRTTPTGEVVWDALTRAHQLGLVAPAHPPRVKISQVSDVFLSVHAETGDYVDDPLVLRVERRSGDVTDWIPWDVDKPAEDVLVTVGRALRKHTAETFDPEAFFNGLADLLEAALSYPDRRPAIQLCPPQWMVCDWGVITYNRAPYPINLQRLQTSDTIDEHVREKSWLDSDSWDEARMTAVALFPPRGNPWGSSGNPWAGATPNYDEPPF